MTLTLTEVTEGAVHLKLEGTVLLANHANPEQANRGFEARLLGYITYDRSAKAITRFSVVAVGDHWGRGPFTLPMSGPAVLPMRLLSAETTPVTPARPLPHVAAPRLPLQLGLART
jgi:hypothetical protein